MHEIRADVLVVGGLGGVAAALGALRAGRTVLLTEQHAWIGGQLTHVSGLCHEPRVAVAVLEEILAPTAGPVCSRCCSRPCRSRPRPTATG